MRPRSSVSWESMCSMEKCIHVVVVRKKKGKEICYCRACEEKSRVRKIKVGDDGWRSIFDRKLRRVLLLPPRSINILIFFSLSQNSCLPVAFFLPVGEREQYPQKREMVEISLFPA